MVDFVVLFGPPCCGKTFFCSQLISDFPEKRYVRVSPSELFYKSPDLSLHKVINRITNLLRKGQSVILDDTQQSQVERTRRTYIQAIKSKITNCNFVAMLLYPEGGKLQSCWANEFAFSEHSVLLDKNGNTISSASYREPDIENWFLHSSVPKSEEGFAEIREISCNLRISQSIPASRKIVLLNACSILDFQPQYRFDSFGIFNLKSSVSDILHEYLESVSQETRVVVLVDESSLFPTTLELLRSELLQQKKAIDHYRNQVRKCLLQLAAFVKQPIFYLIAAYNMFAEKDFFRLPNPGMIAWLQLRHNIDLDQITYIGPANTKTFGESVGILFCDGDMFFKPSGWTVSSKLSKFGTNYFEQRPRFLLEPERVAAPSSSTQQDVLQYLTNHFSKISNNRDQAPIEEKGGPGRIHGVCFPLIKTNDSETVPVQNETITAQHSATSRSERVLPDWMFVDSVATIPSSTSRKKSSPTTQQRLSQSSNSQNATCDTYPERDIKIEEHFLSESLPSQSQQRQANQQLSTVRVKIEDDRPNLHPPLEPIPSQSSNERFADSISIMTQNLPVQDLSEESAEPDIQTLLAKHFGTSALSVFQSSGSNNNNKRSGEQPLDSVNNVNKKPKQSLKTLLE